MAVSSSDPTLTEPEPRYLRPRPSALPVEVPESFGYRLKNRLLGPPLAHRAARSTSGSASRPRSRCSRPTTCRRRRTRPRRSCGSSMPVGRASPRSRWSCRSRSRCSSCSAFLILSYRQTIKAYPTAGGAYIVTRDNFGLLPAQVAGVALLTDYILTGLGVGRGRHRGARVGASRRSRRTSCRSRSSFIVLIAYGNLRGVKESGRLFAVPTYFFIVNMVVLLGIGVVPACSSATCPSSTSTHAGHRAVRQRRAAACSWARRSSWCCTRSRPAAPR